MRKYSIVALPDVDAAVRTTSSSSASGETLELPIIEATETGGLPTRNTTLIDVNAAPFADPATTYEVVRHNTRLGWLERWARNLRRWCS